MSRKTFGGAPSGGRLGLESVSDAVAVAVARGLAAAVEARICDAWVAAALAFGPRRDSGYEQGLESVSQRVQTGRTESHFRCWLRHGLQASDDREVDRDGACMPLVIFIGTPICRAT